MDFSCPCSKGCFPVWIFYENTATGFFPTSVGQVLYRQVEISVWNTRSKIVQWRKQGVPVYWGNVDRESPFSQGSPKVYDTGTIETEIYGPNVTYFAEI